MNFIIDIKTYDDLLFHRRKGLSIYDMHMYFGDELNPIFCDSSVILLHFIGEFKFFNHYMLFKLSNRDVFFEYSIEDGFVYLTSVPCTSQLFSDLFDFYYRIIF